VFPLNFRRETKPPFFLSRVFSFNLKAGSPYGGPSNPVLLGTSDLFFRPLSLLCESLGLLSFEGSSLHFYLPLFSLQLRMLFHLQTCPDLSNHRLCLMVVRPPTFWKHTLAPLLYPHFFPVATLSHQSPLLLLDSFVFLPGSVEMVSLSFGFFFFFCTFPPFFFET